MEVTLTLRKKCGKNGKEKVMNGMVFQYSYYVRMPITWIVTKTKKGGK